MQRRLNAPVGLLAGVALGVIAIALAAGKVGTADAAELELQPPPPPLAQGLLVPTVSLSIHLDSHISVSSVPVGTLVHARAVVGGSGATPTGSVVFAWYKNGLCSGDAYLSGKQSLVGGIAHEANRTRPLTAITYSVKARYEGNSTYASRSVCKQLTVTKSSPTMAVEFHDANHNTVGGVFIGQRFHVHVKMSGLITVTGTVTFTISDQSDCSPSESLGSRTLSEGVAESAASYSDTARSLYVRARYAGNDAYLAKTGPCKEINIDKRIATMTVTAHTAAHAAVTAPVKLLTKLHFSVQVTGAAGVATGPISLRTFRDSSCTNLTSQTAKFVTAGSFDESVSGVESGLAEPGDRYWQVRYSGDEHYQSGSSKCMKVSWRATPSIDLNIHDPAHALVASVVAGTKVHAEVSLRGSFPDKLGLVEFRSYADSTCTTNMISSGNRALQDGALHASDFERTTTSGAARSFQVVYTAANASDYLSRTSACVAVTILPAPTTPPATTTPAGTPKPGNTVAPGASVEPSAGTPSVTLEPEPSGSAPSGEPVSSTAPTGPRASIPLASGVPGGATPVPGQTSGPGAVDPSAASGGFDWILLLVALLIMLVAVGSFVLGRRGRRSAG